MEGEARPGVEARPSRPSCSFRRRPLQGPRCDPDDGRWRGCSLGGAIAPASCRSQRPGVPELARLGDRRRGPASPLGGHPGQGGENPDRRELAGHRGAQRRHGRSPARQRGGDGPAPAHPGPGHRRARSEGRRDRPAASGLRAERGPGPGRDRGPQGRGAGADRARGPGAPAEDRLSGDRSGSLVGLEERQRQGAGGDRRRPRWRGARPHRSPGAAERRAPGGLPPAGSGHRRPDPERREAARRPERPAAGLRPDEGAVRRRSPGRRGCEAGRIGWVQGADPGRSGQGGRGPGDRPRVSAPAVAGDGADGAGDRRRPRRHRGGCAASGRGSRASARPADAVLRRAGQAPGARR